ncbi:hypothetical protein AYX14_05478 [Cryptococcus neoformans]|nr:hypothetical protein AYX14_05478 [Cryptococcus neoformans var. grubii]
MPKEHIRKRGKRKTKASDEPSLQPTTHVSEPEPSVSTGIHPARAAMLAGQSIPVQAHSSPQDAQLEDSEREGKDENQWTRGPRVESEFPFGVLDPDVKAYFKSIEEQIKDWEGVSSAGEEREDRQNFLSSVLSELRGHELSAATDPETSIILERLMPSLSDWGRRVIGDSFGDKWEELIRHRFGSHVVQTWMTLAADTLDRESKGIWPPQQAKQDPMAGRLPTMTSLFSSIISILLPAIHRLISSPYASPPLRLLLLILTPRRILPALGTERSANEGLIRSKKSDKWRKNQDVKGKSILGDDQSTAQSSNRALPEDLRLYRKEIRQALMEGLGEAEWKAMGVDAVGSSTVQLILEFEVDEGDAEKQGSLFDILTEGIVTQICSNDQSVFEARPYLLSLIMTQTGTRLSECILSLAPQKVFDAIWSTYFEGKLGKLAGHPYANFVVAKGVSRLQLGKIEKLIEEVLGNSGGRGLIKAARTSVVQALVDRSLVLTDSQRAVFDLIKSCLELPHDKHAFLVPCLMVLKTFPMYQSILTGEKATSPEPAEGNMEDDDVQAEASFAAAARLSAWQNRRSAKPKDNLAPNMQGCLILQAMVGMEQVNEILLESLLSLPIDSIIAYAKSPIASHLLDKVFLERSVPPKYKKKMMMMFMKSYKELVEDRLGSRVMDTIWEQADGYMKEKIARSLIPFVTELGGSQYGKFFIRRADIVLLNRRPDEWREKVLSVRHHFAHQKEAPTPFVGLRDDITKRKKEKHENDEIDELFDSVDTRKKRRIQN